MERYLHFENLDIANVYVESRCSACGQDFNAGAMPDERMMEVVERVRDQFNRHDCGTAEGGVIVPA